MASTPVLRWIRSPAVWLGLAGLALMWSFVVPYWERGLFWDSAFYVSLARSLAGGEGYQYMGRLHVKYPPGFPLMLALVEVLGGGFRAMHALVGVAGVLGVVLSYALLRELHGRALAACAAAMVLVSFPFVRQLGLILSELPYLALSMGALFAAVRMERDARPRWFASTLLLCVAAYLTRSIGVVLGPAVLLGAWFGARLGKRSDAARAASLPARRSVRVRGAVVAVLVFAVAGAWTGYGRAVGREQGEDLPGLAPYDRQLLRADLRDPSAGDLTPSLVVHRVLANARRYRSYVARSFTGDWQSTAAIQLVTALGVVGWALAFVRRRSVVEFYTAGYVAVLLLWPARSERFVVPILPLVFHYVLAALTPWALRAPVSAVRAADAPAPAVANGAPPRWQAPATAAVGAAAVGAILLANAQLDYAELRAQTPEPRYEPFVVEYRMALAWVQRNTGREVPLVTDQAPMAQALTGRAAYPFAWSSKPREVLASIARWGQPIVVANEFPKSRRHLNPLIARHPKLFRELHRVGTQVIYQFEPERSTATPGGATPQAPTRGVREAGAAFE